MRLNLSGIFQLTAAILSNAYSGLPLSQWELCGGLGPLHGASVMSDSFFAFTVTGLPTFAATTYYLRLGNLQRIEVCLLYCLGGCAVLGCGANFCLKLIYKQKTKSCCILMGRDIT